MSSGIRWRGLRIKIIAWSFVPTALFLALVALAGFSAYEQVMERQAIASSRELARLSAGQLAGELAEFANVLTSVARTADLTTSDPISIGIGLRRASNRLAIFDAGVVVLDNYGTVVAAEPTASDLLGRDWSGQEVFRQMVRTPGTVYSQIISPQASGMRVVLVAVPITGSQGEVLGTLAGMFRVGATSVSSFYGSIVQLRIGAAGTAYLVDRSGSVLYHSDTDRIGDNFSVQSAVQHLQAGKSDALRGRDLTGREIVASFAPVPGTPWGLVIEEDWNALLATGQSYAHFLLLLLALGVLVPAIVVTIGVGRITQPIEQLIDATQKVASGHLGRRITVRTGDELEELARHFNQMSLRLSESYAALQAREERLALAMQGTNDGYWDWDVRTDDTYFSPRWKSMLGYADDEVANRFEAWRELIHPDDVERALAQVNAYLEGKVPVYELEHRLRHRDGSYRWILARGTALRDQAGRPTRFAGSHTDITERKRAEEATIKSEKRFSQVFSASPVAISVTGLDDGRYVDVNEAWLQLFGYTREEVIGSSSLQLNIWLHPERRTGMIKRLQEAGSLRNYEHLAQTKTGEVRNVSISAEVIELNQERYNLSLVIDITEKKRAEEALQQAYQTLERRVEERTRELSTLLEIVQAAGGSLELEKVLGRVARGLAAAVGVQHCGIYMVDENKQLLVPTRSGADPGSLGPQFLQTFSSRQLDPRDDEFVREIMESRRPVVCLDARTDPRTNKETTRLLGLRGILAIPFVVKDRIVAVAMLPTFDGPHTFTPEQTELGWGIVNAAAMSIENARLYAEARQRADETEALFSVQQAVTGRLDPDAVLQMIADEAKSLTSAQGALVLMLDRDELEVSIVSGAPQELLGVRMRVDQSLSGQTLAAGKPWRTANAQNDPRVNRAIVEQTGIKSLLTVPLFSNAGPIGAIAVTDKATGAFGPEDERVLTMLASGAVVALENARLYREEQARRQEAERRRQVAEGTRKILAVLNSRQSLSETLDYIVSHACRLMGSDAAYIAQYQSTERILTIQSACGLDEEYISELHMSIDTSLCGHALIEHRPVTLPDLHALDEGAMRDRGAVDETALALMSSRGYSALLCVPLVVKDEDYGVITLYYRLPREFSEEETRLAMGIADQAALAIESARLRDQAGRLAAIAERSRLARELHDSVTQSLYSVTLYAEAAARLLTSGKSSDAADHLRELRDTAQEALREMRLLIFELRPPALEKSGLAAALQARLDAVEVRGGIKAELKAEGEENLPAAVQEELYHITQEALNNVIKHANPQHVTVRLQFQDEATSLQVCDDGVGFDLTQAMESGGLGLRGMKERVERIGGTLAISSAPGQGTQVTIRIHRPPNEKGGKQ